MKDLMRTVLFSPYLKDKGPRFTLRLFRLDSEKIGYRLSLRENRETIVLFEAQDFKPSPLHAIDSDSTVAALMGFLTLRRGDTDAEYFDDYTPAQNEFSEQHAEALSCETSSRFGEE